MHPHVHLAVVLSAGLLLELQPMILLVFITSGTMIDLDILLSSWAPEKNHRLLPSHWISLWLGITLIGAFFFEIFFWVGVGGLLHLFLDLLDWGLPILAPINLNLSPHLLPCPPEEKKYPWKWFVQRYYGNKAIVAAEIVSIILVMLLLLSEL
ncbi:MAG: hypothetical protein ACE5OZ_08605 [Candidatus Heimdallarchaeota archaeon]